MPEAEVLRTDFGYECRYYPTVMSGPVFRWTLPASVGFEVSASRDGVMIQKGSPTMGFGDLWRLCSLLALAASVFRQLAKGVGPKAISFDPVPLPSFAERVRGTPGGPSPG